MKPRSCTFLWSCFISYSQDSCIKPLRMWRKEIPRYDGNLIKSVTEGIWRCVPVVLHKVVRTSVSVDEVLNCNHSLQMNRDRTKSVLTLRSHFALKHGPARAPVWKGCVSNDLSPLIYDKHINSDRLIMVIPSPTPATFSLTPLYIYIIIYLFGFREKQCKLMELRV